MVQLVMGSVMVIVDAVAHAVARPMGLLGFMGLIGPVVQPGMGFLEPMLQLVMGLIRPMDQLVTGLMGPMVQLVMVIVDK